jgi:four helix bundle protein
MRKITPRNDGFIPPHGGYAGLLAYQKAIIVFQATARFCQRFLKRTDRTIDQMVQAARSGKQNIVECSKISGTSKEAEIKLINVARSSLEELLEDYKDFLRVHGLKLWSKDSREALFVRKLGAKRDTSYTACETYIDTRPPEVVPIFLSVSFIKPITCSTSSYANSRRISWTKAVSVSA